MNKLTEQYKKEKNKYNPLYWIGVIGVVVCIVLDVIFTKIILMILALLFLSLLVLGIAMIIGIWVFAETKYGFLIDVVL